MKKRLVALLLVLVMVVSLLPALPASAVEVDETDQIFTVEKYDENGNGTFLVLPKRAAKASNYTYGSKWIANAIGSDLVAHDGSYITAIQDASQGDGWLNNGDIVSTSRWIVSASGVCYDDTSWFYASEAKVVRVIFSPAGDGSEFNLSNAGWADLGTMAVNKDSLIDLVSRYSADDFAEGSAQAEAYQAALDLIVNLKATQEEVDAAEEAFAESMRIHATGIEIVCTEGGVLEEGVLLLGVNKTAALTAVLDPENSTDTVTWSVADPEVASVDADGKVTGLKQGGETTLTAVANDAVSATIQVSVTRVEAESITLEDVELTVGETVTLTPVVTPEDYTDTVRWSIEDRSIATVNSQGRVTALKSGETKISATVNGHTATAKLTVNDREDPYVYFEYSDGSVQQMVDGTFTLGSLDEGYFRVANAEATPWWENEEVIDAGQGSVTYHWYVNRETGAWQPSGLQPTKPIVVTAGSFTQSFEIIYQESSGVEALRAYVLEDGQPKYLDTTDENCFTVTGCVWSVPVYTEGLVNGEWEEIPVQALKYDTSDNVYYNFRFVGNEMIIDRAGSATMTVSMKGEDVSTSFKAVCEEVLATAMEVVIPEVCYIDEWQDNGQHYVGVRPFTGYQINFTPENATNRDVTWESLTPEVATHSDLHNDGIIPYKAGTAEFIVTNVQDPTLTQTVTVTFVYRNPLTAASTEEAYAMRAGEVMDLTIQFTPANATEQRFVWTYSQEGIVEVTDKILSDDSGTVSWTIHQVEALKEGYVTVTGTPYDQTGGCAPITFTVTVGEGVPEEPADIDKIVSEGIAGAQGVLENAYPDHVYEYGDEWAVFMLTRSGKNLTEEQIDHYLATVVEAYTNPTNAEQKPTTIARVILAVSVLGRDAADLGGIDLTELLYNSDSIPNGSNEAAWALIALDSCDYAIPEGAKWTRDKLIDVVLSFQNPVSGGFGLGDNQTVDVDLTAMCIQALAPYYNSNGAVQPAVDAALAFLQSRMDRYCDFGSPESTAQVLIALAALEQDPLDEVNGFVKSVARNLITALNIYRVEGSGFRHSLNEVTANNMASIQALQALTAYNRYRSGKTFLYDLSDVKKTDQSGEKPADPEEPTNPDEPTNPGAVSTGDAADAALWAGLMVVSMLGIAALLTGLGKKKCSGRYGK